MKIDKLIPDFWKTKSHIQTAILGSAGWNAKVFDAEMVAGPQVFMYFFDLPTKHIWMASTSKEIFHQLSLAASLNKKITQDIRDALGSGIVAMASSKPAPPVVDGLDREQQLSFLLASYAGTTQTWEHANQMKAGGHFIVLNYRKSKADTNTMLRPFAYADTGNSILPSEEFFGLIKRVMDMDRKNHPEWF